MSWIAQVVQEVPDATMLRHFSFITGGHFQNISSSSFPSLLVPIHWAIVLPVILYFTFKNWDSMQKEQLDQFQQWLEKKWRYFQFTFWVKEIIRSLMSYVETWKNVMVTCVSNSRFLWQVQCRNNIGLLSVLSLLIHLHMPVTFLIQEILC